MKVSVIILAALFFLAAAAPRAARSEELQERMRALAGTEEKTTVEADGITYDRKAGTYTAVGNVKITRGESELTAKKVTMDELTGEALAEGNAVFVTRGNVLFAESMKVNFKTEVGEITKGRIFVRDENYHIAGDSLRKVSEDEFTVSSGTFTTCDAPVPFWRVTAKKLDVRMDKDVSARGVVLKIKDIPVLYTPYAWFPLLKPRTSGFLIPGAGYSTKDGARLFTSFYWAPLDNFDSTISLDYRSKRGVGVVNETRFALDKDTLTNFYGYWMDDRRDNRTRYNILLKHQQVATPTLSGRLLLNLSDREYFRDLAETAKDRTQRSIDSNLFITERHDWWRAYLFGQYTRGLDVTNTDLIVQRAPEAGFNVIKKQLAGLPLYLDADASAVNFYRDRGVTAGRFELFPRLSGYWSAAGITFSPRIGYRETFYDLHGDGKEALDDERGLLGMGVKAETGFYKLYTFSRGPLAGLRHTVEPSVAYNYVTKRGGDNFPKFDEADTYGRRSRAAYSLANRFVLKYRGRPEKPDFFTLKFSQFYDYYRERAGGRDRGFSNLHGEAVYEAARPLITVSNDFRYDPYSGNLLSINTDVKYEMPARRWYFILGQRFSKDPGQTFLSPSQFDFFTPTTDFPSDFRIARSPDEEDRVNFITFEAGGKITSYLSASGKVWYDMHTDNFRETDLSVSYTSQCWGISANYQNHPNERQVLIVFMLKGLGNVKI